MYNEQEVRQQLNKYLDLGFHPIWLKGKVANYAWKDFTLTKTNMFRYIKPGISWGIRSGLLPSGAYLWFVDLDSRVLLADVLESNPELLDAPLVATGKGFHIYLCWTHEVKTMHLLESKIDIIGNGYVVAPPSIHQNGKQYKFVRPLNSQPPVVDPGALKFINQSSTTSSIINKPVAQVPLKLSEGAVEGVTDFAGVEQGARHSTLVRIIGIMLTWHFSEEETLREALIWNKRNKPPMTQAEVINTVRDCYQRYDRYEIKRK